MLSTSRFVADTPESFSALLHPAFIAFSSYGPTTRRAGTRLSGTVIVATAIVATIAVVPNIAAAT
jgi:hypothetical protein